MLKPVVLPSGLVRERTKPCATMSVEFPSIGMVFVACCAARTAGSPAQMITSTLALMIFGGFTFVPLGDDAVEWRDHALVGPLRPSGRGPAHEYGAGAGAYWFHGPWVRSANLQPHDTFIEYTTIDCPIGG
jgi:hypothetical protein